MRHCKTILSVYLTTVLASACSADSEHLLLPDEAPADVPKLSAVLSDANGEHEFEVDVYYGSAVDDVEARALLSNMEIVPIAEAFPDVDPALLRDVRPRAGPG